MKGVYSQSEDAPWRDPCHHVMLRRCTRERKEEQKHSKNLIVPTINLFVSTTGMNFSVVIFLQIRLPLST